MLCSAVSGQSWTSELSAEWKEQQSRTDQEHQDRSERARAGGPAAITSSDTDTPAPPPHSTHGTQDQHSNTNMPLFGKAKPKEKPKEEVGKVTRTPTVEDKYDMKDVLGTWVLLFLVLPSVCPTISFPWGSLVESSPHLLFYVEASVELWKTLIRYPGSVCSGRGPCC